MPTDPRGVHSYTAKQTGKAEDSVLRKGPRSAWDAFIAIRLVARVALVAFAVGFIAFRAVDGTCE